MFDLTTRTLTIRQNKTFGLQVSGGRFADDQDIDVAKVRAPKVPTSTKGVM